MTHSSSAPLRPANQLSARSMHARLMTLCRLIRLQPLLFTVVWPLLALTATRSDNSERELLFVIAIAVSFHVYSYVLNDVIDLPIDRTRPERAWDPLVRSLIAPSHALVVA